MEEQRLPWWKRAFRAAIGTLKSGFGLFGRPQPDAGPEAKPVHEPVEEVQVDEAKISESMERSEPEPEVATEPEPEVVTEPEPEVARVAESEPEIQVEELVSIRPEPIDELVIAEIEPEVEEPTTDATSEVEVDEKPALPVAQVEAEIEPTVIEEPEMEAPIEAVAAEIEEEQTEPEALSEIVDAEEENELEEVAVEESDEPVEIEEVPEEQESVPEVTMETVHEVEQEADRPVEVDLPIEADSAPLEEEESPFEEDVESKELLSAQPETSFAESIPAPEKEIEEMKPLQEEKISEVETSEVEASEVDTIDAESQSRAGATVPELASEPVDEDEVSAVAVLTEGAIESVAATAPAVEAPAEQHPIKHLIKEDDDKSSPFSIIVSQVYEGPMDLLLDLIRKQDIDIYDIPIAKITEQFLTYVERLRATDMDMAGEFIYTASLLIHIKSKTLLPRMPSGQDDAYEDPRRELVERLLEHERFKNAAQMLQQKQILEDATWTNPGIREFKGDAGTEPELAADTVDLVRVFREILDRARNRPVINVEEDSVTVGQMIQFLGRRLNMEDRPIALHKLLAHTHSQRALVAMFLALLELVRLQAILLRQDKLFSEIFIKKSDGFDSVMTEGFLAARDDWQ